MEINSQTNVFTRGMDMDSDISMLPEGSYRYAENIRLVTNSGGTTGVLQNIEHIRKYAKGISEDEQIIGTSNTLLYDKNNKTTKEVGIVLTKKYENNNIVYNTLYVVDGFDSIDIVTTPVLKGYLELENNVKIVCNYETANVSNVYITDGKTPIKVINIADQLKLIESGNSIVVYDPTRYDITPGAVMIPFKLVGKIDGVLPAGAVQYAYQLFNEHGGITAISALSEVIPIVNQSSSIKNTKGGIKEEITDMGCQIKAQFQNDGRFDRIRIFTIVYVDNISVPNIYIANELLIPNVGNNEFVDIVYNDTGNGYISQITIDEFNALTPYEFTAISIEKMQNRLFASNIQELTWDVDFDARAYRCDINRNVELHSVTTGEVIKGILKSDGNIYDSTEKNKITIPEEHDCINPSNVDVLGNNQVYTYFPTGLGNNVIQGGLGPNIQYRFTYTKIPLSSSNVEEMRGNYPDYAQTVDITVDTLSSTLTTYYEDGSLCKIHNLPEQGIIANYADPYMCANFLGYQRDEIYRFGIIFYNNKNIPSPVHWIGDIKMPSIHCSTDTSSLYYPFHYGEDGKELHGYVLGIEFVVKNIPEEAFAYEIVRCDRTESDRTVVCQGALSATMAYTHAGEEDNNYGNIDTRPLIQLMLPKDTIYMMCGKEEELDWRNGKESIRSDCFEFASPEMCIGGESTVNLINKSYINPLYYVSSATYPVWKDGSNYFTTGIRPTNIHDVASADNKMIINAYVDETREYPYPRILTDYSGGVWQSYLSLGLTEDEGDKERCLVAKCYKMQPTNLMINISQKSLFIEDAIVSKMIPFYRKFDDLKNYIQFVGDYAYVNSSYQYGFSPNHGICGVLVAKGFDGFITLQTLGAHNPTEFNEFCTSAICNIKRNIVPYNGNAYVNRQTSVYQSCGCFNVENITNKILCFGGDTYLNIFDYQNTVVVQASSDIADDNEDKVCHVSYIPLESVINLNYRTTDSFSKLSSGTTGENRIQVEPMTYQSWVQKTPLYSYNSVYSQTSGSKQYVAKGMYAEDDVVINNRIVVSEQKTNNELIDSWTNFKVANYLDVDTKFGPITNIKSFKNRLYFWLNSAVGIAAVNERSLITDNNSAQLVLGTGDILSRFDYITELNGSSINNDKSIVNSSSHLYWYDFDKNVICQLGEGFNLLSKSGNVQSYLNKLSPTHKTNPVSFYDNKYNEVWFRLYDKALVFNEKLNVFTSFYTHNPNWFFPFSDKLVTIKNNNMYYLHNIYDVNSSISEERTSKIQFIVNKDITNTKVFDNVVFGADFVDNNNSIPTIVKNVLFETKTQTTHLKTDQSYSEIDVREDNYRFAIPREKVDNDAVIQTSSQSYPSRMRGKYLICDYTFDCNSNKEFKIPYIKTTYRYSML